MAGTSSRPRIPNTLEEIRLKRLLAIFALMAGGFAQAVEPIIVEPVPIQMVGDFQLPDGDYYIHAPLEWKNQQGVNVRGGKKSRIIYNGAPTKLGAIVFKGVRVGLIQDVEMLCAKPDVESAVCITNSDVVGGFISHAIEIKNVRVRHGGYQTAFKKAFAIDSYAGDPLRVKKGSNNEMHRILNCSSESHTVAGVYIEGHQSHANVIRDSAFGDAIGRRPYGVWAKEGVFFRAENVTMHTNSCDYQCGQPHIQAVIDGHNSEHSWQLIANCTRNPDGSYATGSSGAKYNTTIKNVRWDGEPKEHLPVIDMWGPGPFTISNAHLAGIKGLCPRIAFDNYSDKIAGVWTPRYGTSDFNGVTIRQMLGVMPTGILIKTPAPWANRTHGLEYEYMRPDGSYIYKRLTINQPLP